jgi:hypothetical protein
MKSLSENTFTILTTHYILDDLAARGAIEPYAVSPTQFDEDWLGYDAMISQVKLLLIQYKRPYKLSKGIRFYLNPLQTITLFANANVRRGVAYFCFPAILYEDDLATEIRAGTYFDNMYFVDVADMNPIYDRALISGGDVYLENSWGSQRVPREEWVTIEEKLRKCRRGLPYLRRVDGQHVKTDEGQRFDRVRTDLTELTQYARDLPREEEEILESARTVAHSWSDILDLRSRTIEVGSWVEALESLLHKSMVRQGVVDLVNGGIRSCQFVRSPLP